jgi:hypothetical protein
MTSSTGIRLTPARREGLAVLYLQGHARISNVTSRDHRLVYWQTAAWLVDEGLAEHADPDELLITPYGSRIAGQT